MSTTSNSVPINNTTQIPTRGIRVNSESDEKNVVSISSSSEQMIAQTADHSDEQQTPNDKTTTSADISRENNTNSQQSDDKSKPNLSILPTWA
ncbi:unnamed protein product [Rotaria sordida]|uniref:Uncharacterized protein n=1 Tax=Rotaria sordida TaxID=392033 RepID=A0A815TN67_9BILA|nr:unnamed protein product [Rotaria sordida]CAF1505311.1 unnamed protein product [Rotaria sordida]CAF1641551.1 unnamed protein product [Rotaria sordida]CAF4169485.1 unnamed protein product [Rotaria sordida]